MGCQRAGPPRLRPFPRLSRTRPRRHPAHLPSGADLAYLLGEPRSAEPCQEVDMYTQLGLYIDGEWLNGDGRAGEDVINPANEKVLARLPHASTADLDRALAAAVKGFAVWRETSAHDRARIMKKAADLLRERAERVARVLTQEQGKILGEARMEVLTTADIVEWYAEEGKRAYGRIVPGRVKGTRQLVIQEPVGVVTAFTPWNFPTLTPARKIGGALAAGCSILIKAPEEAPRRARAAGRSRPDARSSSRPRKRRPAAPSSWCAASSTPAFRPACSTWCSACPRRSRSICCGRTRCGRFRSPVRFRSASISPSSPRTA